MGVLTYNLAGTPRCFYIGPPDCTSVWLESATPFGATVPCSPEFGCWAEPEPEPSDEGGWRYGARSGKLWAMASSRVLRYDCPRKEDDGVSQG